jgi:hypothetical protein
MGYLLILIICNVIFTNALTLKNCLFDVPVSNHGARIRLLTRFKRIEIDIKNPSELGGLKSIEYAKYTIQVKQNF